MTAAQEEKFRNTVISEYGITNEDITVEVNEDGTTSIEIRHLDPKLEYDENGNPVKYYVSVSFDVTANQYAQGKSYYYTSTDYAAVIIDGIMIDKFASPSVSVNDDRNLVVLPLATISMQSARQTSAMQSKPLNAITFIGIFPKILRFQKNIPSLKEHILRRLKK